MRWMTGLGSYGSTSQVVILLKRRGLKVDGMISREIFARPHLALGHVYRQLLWRHVHESVRPLVRRGVRDEVRHIGPSGSCEQRHARNITGGNHVSNVTE